MNEFAAKERQKPRCVLVVEDDDGLQRLIVRKLQKAGYQTKGAVTAHAAIEMVIQWKEEDPELVLLLDQNLPDMTGRDMLNILEKNNIRFPFVIMTGQGDERLAVDMMKMGAADYLLKDLNLIDRLPEVFNRLFIRLETEQRLLAAEALLKVAAEEHRILLDNIQPQVWYLTDPDTYGAVNESHAAFLGTKKEALESKEKRLLPENYVIEAFWKGNGKVFAGSVVQAEEWVTHFSGQERCVFIIKKPVIGENGKVTSVVCTAEDITERKLAEKALLESQEQIRIQQLKFQEELLLSIIQILELYDIYTRGHSENVARYSSLIARKINPDPAWAKEVYWAGLVHDIGKLLVPTQILNKPGRLTDEEYELVKMHPVWGAKVLMTSEKLLDIGRFVLHHHERYDGRGYPDGISGNAIPLASRIICVADSYDAMTSQRSYRTPFTPQQAKEELKRNKSIQFDPEIVDVFLSLDSESQKTLEASENGDTGSVNRLWESTKKA